MINKFAHYIFILFAVVLLNIPTQANAQGYAVVAIKKSVSKPEGLKGKRIAIHGDSTEFLAEFLERAELKIPDVRLVPAKQATGMEKRQKAPAALFRDRKLAAAVVTMDEAMILSLNDTIGDGTKGSVKGAIILKFEPGDGERDAGMDEANGQAGTRNPGDTSPESTDSASSTNDTDSGLGTNNGTESGNNTGDASGNTAGSSTGLGTGNTRSGIGASGNASGSSRLTDSGSSGLSDGSKADNAPGQANGRGDRTLSDIPGRGVGNTGLGAGAGNDNINDRTGADNDNNQNGQGERQRADDNARNRNNGRTNPFDGRGSRSEKENDDINIRRGENAGDNTQNAGLLDRLRDAITNPFKNNDQSGSNTTPAQNNSNITSNVISNNRGATSRTSRGQSSSSTPGLSSQDNLNRVGDLSGTTNPSRTTPAQAQSNPGRDLASGLIRGNNPDQSDGNVSPAQQLQRLQEQADVIASLHNACIYARESFYSMPYPLEASYDFDDLFRFAFPQLPSISGGLGMMFNLSPMSCDSDLALKAQLNPTLAIQSTCYDERNLCKTQCKTPDWCYDEAQKALQADLSPCAPKPQNCLKTCYDQIPECGQLPSISDPSRISSDNSDYIIDDMSRDIEASSEEWGVPLLETASIVALEQHVRDRSIHWRQKIDMLTFIFGGMDYEKALLVKRPIFTMSDSETAKEALEEMDRQSNQFFEGLAEQIMNLYIVNILETTILDDIIGAVSNSASTFFGSKNEFEGDINNAIDELNEAIPLLDAALVRIANGMSAFNATEKTAALAAIQDVRDAINPLITASFVSANGVDLAYNIIEDDVDPPGVAGARTELINLRSFMQDQNNIDNAFGTTGTSAKDVICNGMTFPNLLLQLTTETATEFLSVTPFNEDYDALFTPASCASGATPAQIAADIADINTKIENAQSQFVSFGWFFDIVLTVLTSPVLGQAKQALDDGGVPVQPASTLTAMVQMMKAAFEGDFGGMVSGLWSLAKATAENLMDNVIDFDTIKKAFQKGVGNGVSWFIKQIVSIPFKMLNSVIKVFKTTLISIKIIGNFFGIYQMHKERLSTIVKGLEYARIRSSFTAEGCGGSTPTSRPALNMIHDELQKYYDWRQAQIDAPENEKVFDEELFNEYMTEFDSVYTQVRDNPCARDYNEKLQDYLVDPPPLPPYIVRDTDG